MWSRENSAPIFSHWVSRKVDHTIFRKLLFENYFSNDFLKLGVAEFLENNMDCFMAEFCWEKNMGFMRKNSVHVNCSLCLK